MLARTLLTAAALVTPLAGCAKEKPVEVGEAVYKTGGLTTRYTADIATVYQAVLQAMDRLEYKTTLRRRDALEASIEGQQSDGTDIAISLDRDKDASTVLTLRVGWLGNRKQSEMILSEITKAVGD